MMSTVVKCDICQSVDNKPGKCIRIYPMPESAFDIFQKVEATYDVCELCMIQLDGFFVKEDNGN